MKINTLAVENADSWGNFQDLQIGIIQGELDTIDIETTIEDDYDGLYLVIKDYEEQALIITVSEDIDEIIECLPDQFADYRVLTEETASHKELELTVKPVFTVKSKSLVQAVLAIDWESV
jgi:hypothetical protein